MTRAAVPLLIVLCVLVGLSTHMVVNCGDEDDPDVCAEMQTPALTVGSTGVNLQYWERHQMEYHWDGVAVEYSRNGGAWTDVPAPSNSTGAGCSASDSTTNWETLSCTGPVPKSIEVTASPRFSALEPSAPARGASAGSAALSGSFPGLLVTRAQMPSAPATMATPKPTSPDAVPL